MTRRQAMELWATMTKSTEFYSQCSMLEGIPRLLFGRNDTAVEHARGLLREMADALTTPAPSKSEMLKGGRTKWTQSKRIKHRRRGRRDGNE